MQAVIFIGIQASGKTSFYLQRFFDACSAQLGHVEDSAPREVAFRSLYCSQAALCGDNTNMRLQERAEYIVRAQATEFQVVGYFFEPQVGQALAWNQRRSGKAGIPVQGLLGTLKRLERPCADEGFDALYRVRVEQAGEFVVEEWSPSG